MSSWVLHDEAIQNTVSLEKPPKKSTKRLQYSQAAHQLQGMKCTGSPAGEGDSLIYVIWYQNSLFLWQSQEGEEVLRVSCLSLSCRWEVF